jgi:peptidoglycan/LPS O-acetylase OafA/YrhL
LDDLDIHQFILNLIFGNTLGIYYFVFVLFYLYAFSLLLRRIPNRWVLVFWGASLILLLLFVKKPYPENLSFFQLLRHPFFHLFSYLTGWIYSLHYQRINSLIKRNMTFLLITLVLLDAVIFIGTGMNGERLNSFPMLMQFHIYLFVALLLTIGTKPTKHQEVVLKISSYSYGIYLLHFPIVRSCQFFLYPDKSGDYSFPYAFVSWIVGLSVSMIIIVAIRKILGRHSVYLVGC